MSLRFEIVVVNGPGVIVGNSVVESIGSELNIDSIQFSDVGIYELCLKNLDGIVDDNNFTLNVKEYFPEQDESNRKEEKVTGDRPIIAQIDSPTISLKPMEYDVENTTQSDVGSHIGFTPFMWYGANQISSSDIISFELYHDSIVPSVSVIFRDSNGLLKSVPPLADSTFEIFLNSNSENLKSIHLRLKITYYKEGANGAYTMIGVMDLKNFYNDEFTSYSGTSFETLRFLAKNHNLGFNSNILATNDSMVWKSSGDSNFRFIKKILNHAYINDDSFVLGYIDHYYCFNYVDIEKEWKRDISNDVGINSYGPSSLSNNSETDRITKLLLTNDQGDRNSVNYIESYNVNNNATTQTMKKGNKKISKVYDQNSKSFLIFDVEPLKSNDDSLHVLDGNPFSDNSDIYKAKNSGKVDLTNVHSEYYYSESLNEINLENLARITMDIVLPNVNFNIYKFMKIQVNIINNAQSLTDEGVLNKRYSGEWIIIDIRYIYRSGKLTQNVRLARKELGKTETESEISTESREDKNGNNIRSENPNNPIEPDEFVMDEFIFSDFDNSSLSEEYQVLNFEGEEEQEYVEETQGLGTEFEYTFSGGSSDSNVLTTSSNESDKWKDVMIDGSEFPDGLNFNLKPTINNLIKKEYIPVINSMPLTKGMKLLCVIMAQKEGFTKDSRSYRTNNPGNIGNTDSGSNKVNKTLADGIKLQVDYIKKVANGTHSMYPMNGNKVIKPYYSPEIASNRHIYKMSPYLPGYTFVYTGAIEQYVKIYSTGARGGNSYLNMIVSWFRMNGYPWVNNKTTIKQLIEQDNKPNGTWKFNV